MRGAAGEGAVEHAHVGGVVLPGQGDLHVEYGADGDFGAGEVEFAGAEQEAELHGASGIQRVCARPCAHALRHDFEAKPAGQGVCAVGEQDAVGPDGADGVQVVVVVG